MKPAGTESSWSWAYPNGRITTETWAGPARVKQADGSFHWIDTTLVERDGALQPKVAKADIRFSAGGDVQLATLEDDTKDQRFAIQWPAQLPKPRIDGNKAIYDISSPGLKADLVVTALAMGFRHDVVLRERPTVPVEFRLPVRTKGLTLAETKAGGLKLTDGKGKTVASAAEPFMVEAPSMDVRTGPNMRGKIDAQVTGTTGDQTLVLKPDPKFLADKDTTYPVTVDPTVSLTATTDAWVQARTGAADASGSELNVGTGTYWQSESQCSGGVCTHTNKTYPNFLRAYVGFGSISGFANKYVESATIQLLGSYTGSCVSRTITMSPITSSWSTGSLTWGSLPPTSGTGAVTVTPSCASDAVTSFNVTQMARNWAGGTASYGVELKSTEDPRTSWPDDPNPVTAQYWAFNSVESGQTPPKLSVNYLLPPEIPTVTGESIDSMTGNDAISRTSDVKVNYSSSSIDGKNIDYQVSISDPTTPIPVPTASPSPTPTAPPPGTGDGDLSAAAQWRLDEGSGTSAADGSGHGFTATLSETATWGAGKFGNAVAKSGGQVATASGPVVRTDQSYTVAGWVKLNDRTGWYELVQQHGTYRAPFYLGVDAPTGDLVFYIYTADTSTWNGIGATSTTDAPVGEWFHLAGVYDKTAGSISLYLNGTLLKTTTGIPALWHAPGATAVGRNINGAIDDVRLYQKALTATEIRNLTSLRGYWPFDEGSGTSSADASGHAHPATLSGTTTWGTGKFTNAAYRSTGAAATASTAVLRTDDSYTVAGWLKLNDRTGWYELVQQHGTFRAPFYLGVDAPTGDLVFYIYTADTSTWNGIGATSTTDAPVGEWFHLAGVYDKTAGSISLYLNGTLLKTTTGIPAGWHAPGATTIGKNINGAVDDVHLFQKALTATEILALKNAATVTPDTPPSASGTLSATAGPDTVNLTWTPATDDRGNLTYQIHRSKTTGFTPSTNTMVGISATTAYTDSGMVQGQYYYRIIAIDSAGQAGPPSNEAAALTSAQLFPPASNVPSGQTINSQFQLGSPDTFKFKIKACITGITPRLCNETPYYRITTDAAYLPTDAATGLIDQKNPILTGMVSRPSGGPVTAKFYLYENGNPVGASPIGKITVNGGSRASIRLADGVVQEGHSYTWQMQSCVGDDTPVPACTSKTAAVSFTVPGEQPPPTYDTTAVTLQQDNFVIKTAKSAADACSGAACTWTDSTAVQVGGAGADKMASVIKINLSAVPIASVPIESLLNLGTPTCSNGTCVSGATFKITRLEDVVSSETTTTGVVKSEDPDFISDLGIASPSADIAGYENAWLLVESDSDQVLTFGDAGQLSLAIDYLPPGPPSKVQHLSLQAGDGGAIATWGVPEDTGSLAFVEGYDIEATGPGGGVVWDGESDTPSATIAGLTNGTTYSVRVRARTHIAAGEWESAEVTPIVLVPAGGTCQTNTSALVGKIESYYDIQNQVLGGGEPDVWAAGATPDNPLTAKLALTNSDLVAENSLMDAAGVSREDDDVAVTDAVAYNGADGLIHLRAHVEHEWTDVSTDGSGNRTETPDGSSGDYEYIQSSCGDTKHVSVVPEVDQSPGDMVLDGGCNYQGECTGDGSGTSPGGGGGGLSGPAQAPNPNTQSYRHECENGGCRIWLGKQRTVVSGLVVETSVETLWVASTRLLPSNPLPDKMKIVDHGNRTSITMSDEIKKGKKYKALRANLKINVSDYLLFRMLGGSISLSNVPSVTPVEGESQLSWTFSTESKTTLFANPLNRPYSLDLECEGWLCGFEKMKGKIDTAVYIDGDSLGRLVNGWELLTVDCPWQWAWTRAL